MMMMMMMMTTTTTTTTMMMMMMMIWKNGQQTCPFYPISLRNRTGRRLLSGPMAAAVSPFVGPTPFYDCETR